MEYEMTLDELNRKKAEREQVCEYIYCCRVLPVAKNISNRLLIGSLPL